MSSLTRFWVSWWSGNYTDEGCSNPPFQYWLSGYRHRDGETERTDLSLMAVIDAETSDQVAAALPRYFPDCELRFIEPQAADFLLAAVFQGSRTEPHWSDRRARPSGG